MKITQGMIDAARDVLVAAGAMSIWAENRWADETVKNALIAAEREWELLQVTDFDAIRVALVEIGKPLEVLIMSGWVDHFTPELQTAIRDGATLCRRMLKELT